MHYFDCAAKRFQHPTQQSHLDVTNPQLATIVDRIMDVAATIYTILQQHSAAYTLINSFYWWCPF